MVQSPISRRSLAIRHVGSGQCEIQYNTLRGFFYKLQTTSDLSQPFSDDAMGFIRAVDSSVVRSEASLPTGSSIVSSAVLDRETALSAFVAAGLRPARAGGPFHPKFGKLRHDPTGLAA